MFNCKVFLLFLSWKTKEEKLGTDIDFWFNGWHCFKAAGPVAFLRVFLDFVWTTAAKLTEFTAAKVAVKIELNPVGEELDVAEGAAAQAVSITSTGIVAREAENLAISIASTAAEDKVVVEAFVAAEKAAAVANSLALANDEEAALSEVEITSAAVDNEGASAIGDLVLALVGPDAEEATALAEAEKAIVAASDETAVLVAAAVTIVPSVLTAADWAADEEAVFAEVAFPSVAAKASASADDETADEEATAGFGIEAKASSSPADDETADEKATSALEIIALASALADDDTADVKAAAELAEVDISSAATEKAAVVEAPEALAVLATASAAANEAADGEAATKLSIVVTVSAAVTAVAPRPGVFARAIKGAVFLLLIKTKISLASSIKTAKSKHAPTVGNVKHVLSSLSLSFKLLSLIEVV